MIDSSDELAMMVPEAKPVWWSPTTLIRTTVCQGVAGRASSPLGPGGDGPCAIVAAGVPVFGFAPSAWAGSDEPAIGRGSPGLDWPRIIGRENAPQPTRMTAATRLICDRNMIWSAPSVRVRTVGGITSLAAHPAASCTAIRAVASIESVPTADRADPAARKPADATTDGSDAAADHPAAQVLAASGQAALDRADRPAEQARRLLVGAAFQVAKDRPEPGTVPAAGRSLRG